MITAPRLDPSTFPDSPYAAELQRGAPRLRFAPVLEAEYLHSRLCSSRTLIRVASMFAVLMTVIRGLDELYHGTRGSELPLAFTLIMAGSLALAAIAWSPHFERLYPRWAQILIPTRNAIISAQIAATAARGQTEMLMLLPLMLIGPFFFLGLPLRTTLSCSALTVASYLVSATLCGLPPVVAMRADVLLLGGLVVCLIALWDREKAARLTFLEGNLIAELAQRDPLTGAKNRWVFDEQLEHLWRAAVDNRKAMAILLIDIDHFKAYNDHYGHLAGDQTLRRVAQTLQKLVRAPHDIVTRYGGEEFAVILNDVCTQRALEMAERMRLAVAEAGIEHRASRTSTRVTISVGVAAIEPSADRNPRGVLQLADQALYQAKVQGRNRVELMDDTHHSLLVTGVFAINPDRTLNCDRAANTERSAKA